MEGVNDGEDQRKAEGAEVRWVKRMNWTICGAFHTNTHQFQRLSIDPPIGSGFARSLVPIMANSSHQRLGPPVLMSGL